MTDEDTRILSLMGDMLADAEETAITQGWTSAQMESLERECDRATKYLSDPELAGITYEPLLALRRVTSLV